MGAAKAVKPGRLTHPSRPLPGSVQSGPSKDRRGEGEIIRVPSAGPFLNGQKTREGSPSWLSCDEPSSGKGLEHRRMVFEALIGVSSGQGRT